MSSVIWSWRRHFLWRFPRLFMFLDRHGLLDWPEPKRFGLVDPRTYDDLGIEYDDDDVCSDCPH